MAPAAGPRASAKRMCARCSPAAPRRFFDDFHIDGIRVDLTDAIHQNNALHANGSPVAAANQYGAKFLRELARTVLMVKPSAFLIAEDYTGWSAMTQPVNQGGEGFDAVWYMDFYHNLIGDGNYGNSYANLLRSAGFGVPAPYTWTTSPVRFWRRNTIRSRITKATTKRATTQVPSAPW